jgi:hypothetical protein
VATVLFYCVLSVHFIHFPTHFFEPKFKFGDLNVLIFNYDLPFIEDDVLETLIDSGLNELGSSLIADHSYQQFIREDLFVCLLKSSLERLILLRIKLLDFFQFLFVDLLKGLTNIELFPSVVAV